MKTAYRGVNRKPRSPVPPSNLATFKVRPIGPPIQLDPETVVGVAAVPGNVVLIETFDGVFDIPGKTLFEVIKTLVEACDSE